MAVDYSAIEGALNNAMAGEFTDIDVHFENAQSETSDGTPDQPDVEENHINTYFVPATSGKIEVGSNGKERATGIYQIDLHVPLFSGKYDLYAMLARVLSIFEVGSQIQNGSIYVRILSSYPGPSFKEEPYYRMPVTVNWQSDQ